MNKQFTTSELKKAYSILKAYDENLIVNPTEQWEMDHYDEPLADKKGLKQILRKIESLLPAEDAKESKKTILRRRYDSFNNEINESVYRKIESAFDGRNTLEIGYFDMESAGVIPRQVDVYYKSRKYVIAYCHLRKAIRKFRTSRITSAKLTEKNYTIPAEFNKNKYL